jgi:hypothetical protein
MSRGSPYILE